MLKIFKSKKADEEIAAKSIFYIVFGILATITIMLIVYIVPVKNAEISQIPPGLDDYITIQRFLSASCFAVNDIETGRTFSNLIALESFNQGNFDNCFRAKESNVKGYRLKLNYGKDPIQVKTENWGGFLESTQTKTVLVKDKGKISLATLTIEVQDAE
jgi:hypothetical protein|tara:strand:- start:587 stop:1063 length:477 start_codon:yes stop_codon:yes gene_type:complete